MAEIGNCILFISTMRSQRSSSKIVHQSGLVSKLESSQLYLELASSGADLEKEIRRNWVPKLSSEFHLPIMTFLGPRLLGSLLEAHYAPSIFCPHPYDSLNQSFWEQPYLCLRLCRSVDWLELPGCGAPEGCGSKAKIILDCLDFF